jgi:hypothetical protein
MATRPVDFRKQADGLAAIVQGAWSRSVLWRGLRVPLQEDGPGEIVVVGWNWHLSDDELRAFILHLLQLQLRILAPLPS